MCGICGFVTKKDIIPEHELIRRMMDRLYHRGPDGRGWFRDRMTCLGHTRLSIIDLEGGTQPLCNEDESLWISFNGEIYNYIELRDELIALGHVFKTKSDTEVIVHAWESWREECFNRFNGQWAIALWDRRRKELILSRDRHGIRPLYYTEAKDKFLFASEIKAIFADDSVRRAFSLRGLQETFTFWGPVAPYTVFEHIYEIPPGNYAIYKDQRLITAPYWSVRFPDDDKPVSEKDVKDAAMHLKEKLTEASRLRFERSDVPVGAYLSGGIDSSISSTIVSKYAKEGLKTFSIRFSDKGFDEGDYQKQMVERLGTDHKSFMVEPEDIGAIFPEVIYHTERPILRTAPAPLFLLSRLVRESGYKVVVTGEGSDEVLGGYDIFREAFVRRKIAQKGHTEETESLLMKLYPWMGDSFKKTPAFTRSFFCKNISLDDPALSHRPRWDNSRLLSPLFSKDMAEAVRQNNIVDPLLAQMPHDKENWSYLAKAQWLEYKTLLSGYILSAQGDRMLMANSVEGRFPFLDVELDEFANGLPPEMKLQTCDLAEKLILKEAFKGDIPEEIINRPKQPYQSPNGKSFLSLVNDHDPNLSWIDQIYDHEIVKDAGLFNPISLEMLRSKCIRLAENKFTYGDDLRLVFVLSTMLIYKEVIKENFLNFKVLENWVENEYTIDYL